MGQEKAGAGGGSRGMMAEVEPGVWTSVVGGEVFGGKAEK